MFINAKKLNAKKVDLKMTTDILEPNAKEMVFPE